MPPGSPGVFASGAIPSAASSLSRTASIRASVSRAESAESTITMTEPSARRPLASSIRSIAVESDRFIVAKTTASATINTPKHTIALIASAPSSKPS